MVLPAIGRSSISFKISRLEFVHLSIFKNMISRHSVQFFSNWIQLRPPVSPRPAAEDAKVGVKVWLKGCGWNFWNLSDWRHRWMRRALGDQYSHWSASHLYGLLYICVIGVAILHNSSLYFYYWQAQVCVFVCLDIRHKSSILNRLIIAF